MAESKKRSADSEAPNELKKPKFEKKTAPKNSGENKTGNPFHRPGKINTCFYDY